MHPTDDILNGNMGEQPCFTSRPFRISFVRSLVSNERGVKVCEYAAMVIQPYSKTAAFSAVTSLWQLNSDRCFVKVLIRNIILSRASRY